MCVVERISEVRERGGDLIGRRGRGHVGVLLLYNADGLGGVRRSGGGPRTAWRRPGASRVYKHRSAARNQPDPSAPARRRRRRHRLRPDTPAHGPRNPHMDFAPKAGCPMCGIVAAAQHGAPGLPARPALAAGAASSAADVVWRDDDFTVYRETAHPVSTRGHLVVAFKCVLLHRSKPSLLTALSFPASRSLHVPSIYALVRHLCRRSAHVVACLLTSDFATYDIIQSSSDLPLLASLKALSTRLLAHQAAASASSSTATSPAGSPQTFAAAAPPLPAGAQVRVGFITPPFKDSKIPVTDHLHAHAFLAPADQLGWWRALSYSPLAWYAVDDLVAEIRYVPLSLIPSPVSPRPSLLPSLISTRN